MGNKPFISIVILVLAMVSCTIQLSPSVKKQDLLSSVVYRTAQPTVTPCIHSKNGGCLQLSTVTAQFVNIRNTDGIATGEIAQAGDVLTVTFRPDGYALISAPAKWAGMLIWRGCTSDAGGYGCEAK